MNWSLAGQIAVVWIIAAVLASPFVGRYFANRRIRNELRTLLNTSNADWAVQHREWIARRRSGEEVKLSRDALVDTIAQGELEREQREFNRTHLTPAQRQKAVELGFIPEEDEPFHLDEPNQPRPAA